MSLMRSSKPVERMVGHIVRSVGPVITRAITTSINAAFANQTRALAENAAWKEQGGDAPKMVFLGPPGVGKGTYAKRVAKHMGVPHIAVGDLLRHEVKEKTEQGLKVQKFIDDGLLVPDQTVLQILKNYLEKTKIDTPGFVLDGYPRTVQQAEALSEFEEVQLVLNLFLREDVLIEKCLGRRICTKCNGNYNVADIYRPADQHGPEIVMPPLAVPEACKDTIITRKDDVIEVIQKRLKIYREESEPLENFYRGKRNLVDFEIRGGIPDTLPKLLSVINENK